MKNDKKYFEDNQSAKLWVIELFARYFNGQATQKEKKAIENWNSEAGNTTYKAPVEEIEKGCETVWQRLSAEFGFDLNLEEPKIARKSRVIQLQNYARYAAAIVVIAVGIGFYFYNNQKVKSAVHPVHIAMDYFESGAGEKKQMTLPDGSVVYLNNDTRIGIATANFNKEKREIWLEEGEAFFEVAKNPEKPFIIHSIGLKTTVLGTSFNIKAYKELDESSVSVRDGKVQVMHQSNLLGVFTKNQQITFNKTTGSTVKSEVSWEDAASWMENRLVMNGANAKEFRLRMKQHFSVIVEIKNNKLDGKLLSCSYPSDVSLKEVMEGISLLYNIKYDLSQSGKLIIY
ncbi:FecR family protein [Flavobacterium fluviatile]|uniref:FecR family protein n=1 Tax=Flavobacterium fluviatile TaxID=1862387 RepID=UPI0013D77A69|nr:FecR family protein [Flavobacterium fluviatile]